ncbi:homeodomain-like superfamily protein [Wolffia australiana]
MGAKSKAKEKKGSRREAMNAPIRRSPRLHSQKGDDPPAQETHSRKRKDPINEVAEFGRSAAKISSNFSSDGEIEDGSERKPCRRSQRLMAVYGESVLRSNGSCLSPRLHSQKGDDPPAQETHSRKRKDHINEVAEFGRSMANISSNFSSDGEIGDGSERKPPRRSQRLMAVYGGSVLPSNGSCFSVGSSNCSIGDEDSSVCLDERAPGEGKKKKIEVSAAPIIEKGRLDKPSKITELKEGISPKRDSLNGTGVSEPLDWTLEQQLALRRAYILAKPSPHFWKKVAKMVPGKTAQECFDRMHSELATPAQLPPRSRSKLPVDHSPVPYSDLFKKNKKKTKSGRRKDHLAPKAVRHILRKHSAVDLAEEVDLFSVLEKTSQNGFPEVPQILSGNEIAFNSPSPLQVPARERKVVLSRMCGPSPDVLRPIKNTVLHERYIDQLHSREARRRMHSEGRVLPVGFRGGKENVVNSAKNALICEANDFIHLFGHKLADPMKNYEVGYEGIEGEEEEEDEEEENEL